MGKDKVQKKMASFAPPHISSSSSMVITTSSFQKLVATIITCINEFWGK
jgi:hypothetical protein